MSILEPGIVFNFSFGEVIGKILIDLCDRVFNFWITHYALFINSNIPHKTSYSYLLHSSCSLVDIGYFEMSV